MVFGHGRIRKKCSQLHSCKKQTNKQKKGRGISSENRGGFSWFARKGNCECQ